MAIQSSDFSNIARAISAYADEAYTEARRVASTGILGSDVRINAGAEDFYGTLRWLKPLGSLQYDGSDSSTNTVINIATEASTEGAKSGVSSAVAEFVKTYRTHGADQYAVTQLISGQDGLAKIARDFATTRARDEEAALVAVLNGVARAEARNAHGTGTGQVSPDEVAEIGDSTDGNGFFVDLNSSAVQAYYAGSAGELIDDAQSSAADKVSPLIAAASIGFKDLEPDFLYLVTTPSQILKLKQANLIDDERIQDGNVQFDTILSGYIRLVPTRTAFRRQDGTAQGAGTDANVETASTLTSFLIKPNAVSLTQAPVVNPVAIDRDESVARGSGQTEAWYRWSYVLHPNGYTFDGDKSGYLQNTSSSAVLGSINAFESSSTNSPWTRVYEPLNLDILPIFHQ